MLETLHGVEVADPFRWLEETEAAEVERSNAFASVANLMPGFMQRGLGSRAMLLATFRGTVAFGYFHPVVCILVAVLAMYFATELAHEVEAGLVDLELARAVPRHRLRFVAGHRAHELRRLSDCSFAGS